MANSAVTFSEERNASMRLSDGRKYTAYLGLAENEGRIFLPGYGGRSNSERLIAYFEQEEMRGEYKATVVITRNFYSGLN